jgi:hypothetical protein
MKKWAGSKQAKWLLSSARVGDLELNLLNNQRGQPMFEYSSQSLPLMLAVFKHACRGR